jgi:DNA adenine methylase
MVIIQKPFLKWVGGKTQMIETIINKFPSSINNYHELFLGGGSVLLALLSYQRDNKIQIQNNIYAYDINEGLINTYKNIQNNKDKLYKYIQKYLTEYDSLTGTVVNRKPQTLDEAKTSKESYYYWLRNKFNSITNKASVEYSALFIFINKTCFRGIYREGPNGFNVPYGHYKTTPKIITKNELDNIHSLIKNVKFICCGFEESITKASTNDFVYLDPPYAPENETSFVGYTKDGFNLDMHNKLFNNIDTLNNNNIKFIMSNAKVKLVTDYFSNYESEDIIARRAIHSKKPNSKTTEIIIYN